MKLLFGFVSAAFIASTWMCSKDNTMAATTPTADEVNFSFVVVGCNRLDKGDTNSANPSTANLEQLNRTFSEVAALNPKPDYFFFAGDMVLGYTADSNKLASELTAWKAQYDGSPVAAAGIKLVAIPGNHESQNDKKIATAAAERQWLRIMAPYIAGSNGPGIGGADSLQTDQSKLCYSFDFKTAHFVIINTDPTGKDWRVPTNWISADVAAAKSAGKAHIFAIGHKPAYPYNYATGGSDGLNLYATNRDQFWSALESNNAEAMFSAHNHIYRRLHPNNKTWMVIAGNGGSKLETDAVASEQFYGFTLVQVYANGKVVEKSYGRNIPTAGYSALCPAATYPTTVRDSAEITWK